MYLGVYTHLFRPLKKKVVSYEKGGLKNFHEGGRKSFFFFTVPNMNASFYFLTFGKNCNFVCRLLLQKCWKDM